MGSVFVFGFLGLAGCLSGALLITSDHAFWGAVLLILGFIFAGSADKALKKHKAEEEEREREILRAKEREQAELRKKLEANDTKEVIKVAGTSFRKDEIADLGMENDDYTLSAKSIVEEGLEDESIYQYEFGILKAKLEPEEDNEHDPNAVKVIISGVHVGYIPKEKSAHIKELVEAGKIRSVKADIKGGNYKYYDSEEETLSKYEREFSIELTIQAMP